MSLFLGVIIGTSFIFDQYFKIIPNYIILTGFYFLFPLLYVNDGWPGVWQGVGGVLISGLLLYGIYLIGGLGAGDVKLICLICGFTGYDLAIRYIILVLFIGAIIGIFKRLLDSIEDGIRPLHDFTRIKFSLPILIAYLLMLLSKGGEL